MRSGAKRHYSICLFEIKKKKLNLCFNLCEPLQGFTKINFYQLFSESFSSSPSSPSSTSSSLLTLRNRNSIIFSFSYNLKVPSIVSKYYPFTFKLQALYPLFFLISLYYSSTYSIRSFI